MCKSGNKSQTGGIFHCSQCHKRGTVYKTMQGWIKWIAFFLSHRVKFRHPIKMMNNSFRTKKRKYGTLLNE